MVIISGTADHRLIFGRKDDKGSARSQGPLKIGLEHFPLVTVRIGMLLPDQWIGSNGIYPFEIL